jgi:hypothetical protein
MGFNLALSLFIDILQTASSIQTLLVNGKEFCSGLPICELRGTEWTWPVVRRCLNICLDRLDKTYKCREWLSSASDAFPDAVVVMIVIMQHSWALLLWLYSPLLGLGRFSIFLILYSQWDSLNGGSARRKTSTYAHRSPCLEWNSNPRPQCFSGRTQFLPYTARPLWLAIQVSTLFITAKGRASSALSHLSSQLFLSDYCIGPVGDDEFAHEGQDSQVMVPAAISASA